MNETLKPWNSMTIEQIAEELQVGLIRLKQGPFDSGMPLAMVEAVEILLSDYLTHPTAVVMEEIRRGFYDMKLILFAADPARDRVQALSDGFEALVDKVSE